MHPSMLSKESELVARVFGPKNPSFSTEAARSILELRFTDADTDRMNALAAKARQGSLSDDEQSQLDAYLFVGAIIDLMHSRARLSLKRAAVDSHGS